MSTRGLRFHGKVFPCTIGRGGVTATKREGDGGTPIGTHRIVGLLYRPDRMPRPAPWAQAIGPGDLWCDAPDHAAYNQPVKAPFKASHERLCRGDRLYDLVLLTNWNHSNPVPGKGSAIFLHRWRRPGYPTEGCIALAPRHLAWIARRSPPGTGLIIPPQP